MFKYFVEMVELVKNAQNSINFTDSEDIEKFGREHAIHNQAFKLNLLMSALCNEYGCKKETKINYDLYGNGRTEYYTISKTGFELRAVRHYTDKEKQCTSDFVKLLGLEVKLDL